MNVSLTMAAVTKLVLTPLAPATAPATKDTNSLMKHYAQVITILDPFIAPLLESKSSEKLLVFEINSDFLNY